MTKLTTAAARPQQLFSPPSIASELRRPTSTIPASPETENSATDLLAKASACALVAASAGFGAVYAWSAGSGHGVILGALAVLFAVALEVVKPLALRNALTAFGQFQIIRGAALVIMAGVAVIYSLTAELSLWASLRSDGMATRQATITLASRAETQTQRADDRYALAKAELETLPPARSKAEVQAEITGLLAANPKAGDCSVLDGRVTRTVCPQVDLLKAEASRADRREALKSEMAAAAIPATIANSTPAAKSVDPGATALATYMAALGIKVDVKTLSEWLSLIPVLALEAGSLFAGLLCAPASRTPNASTKMTCSQSPPCPLAETPANAGNGELFIDGVRVFTTGEEKLSVSDCAAERLLQLLRLQGGALFGGQRAIAKAVNVSAAQINSLLHELAAAGRLSLDVSKSGTRIKLVA